jgi:photosystem II stability/assembly factor-like uncharacterized protein
MNTMRRLVRAALVAVLMPLLATTVFPQGTAPVPPLMINQSTDLLLKPFRFRSIGPASVGGRIDDIAVSESDPSVIYVGYAVGGVFKSDNNGTTFTPVFETYGTASIGDIAIHPANPNIVYVGTGEANNRQTSTFGDGLYKTIDGGKTFTNVGLKDTQTIARIVIDPKNPETVYVASPGHLFGPNAERGVFKTTDGGKTWNKVKFIDDDTGFTDIAIDPVNTNVLYAASYQRRRSGCCFNGGGPGSALWKTTDAGKTWTKLTASAFPSGTYGRIALDVSRSNPNVVYAQIETGPTGTLAPARGADPTASTEATPPGAAAVTPPGGAAPAAGARAANPQPAAGGGGGGRAAGGGRGGYNWCNNAGPGHGFPRGSDQAVVPSLDPSRGGVFRSDNKGGSWTLVSNCNSRPMYFSQLRVDPSNDKAIYVAGLPVAKSLDGGKTFATLDESGGYGEPGHVDQHAIWIDPKNPKHLMIGNDGGLDISWDQGKTWDYVNTMATALAYWVSADMRHPYYVYTGLQDNGSWGGPSATRSSNGILNSDWFGIGGGDGFQTAVDPADYNIVYTESQDGNTNRYDLRGTGRSGSIRPRGPGERGRGFGGGGAQGGRGATGAAAGRGVAGATGAPGAGGEEQAVTPPQQAAGAFGGRGGAPNVLNAGPNDAYRFNWNTPFLLSPHNPSIVWLGGNRLFRSYNRGDTWMASADLTKNVDRNTVALMGVPGDRTQLSKNDGVVSYSTIISISESPVLPGVVWAGTDDGNVQVSRDSGVTFTEVGKAIPGLPSNHQYWISRIDASHFDPAIAYVAVDGHRNDDLKPYLFVTHDYGQTWTSIANNLPAFGNIQVVREDPKNKDLLYVGTEFGLFISLDCGKQWQRFMNNLPTARVDDILVHPRDNDLIVATHARSLWIADDITPLQQMASVGAQDVVLFDVRPAVAYLTDRQRGQQTGGQRAFVGENPPRGTTINYYLKSAATGDVKITIADAMGKVIRTLDGTKDQGINRVNWTLTPQPLGRGGAGGFGGGGRGGATVDAGTYLVTLAVDGKTYTKPLSILQDVWLNER